ncbi:MAG: fibronectin type III domain-containing protein [Planctomycetes bacterium]|nr:fibronectin type III domain-containing protein [Planctomycetota bacterium]
MHLITRCVLLVAATVLHAAAADVWTRKAGTLSMDPQGWAFSPSITSRADGTLYAVWAQHRKADVPEEVSPYAATWVNGAWVPLGGRIGTPNREGYDPTIAVLGTTPYVAWYEGQGYGWGTIDGVFYPSSIMVKHWTGSAWVADPNAAMGNGGLNTSTAVSGYSTFARNPRMAVIAGRLYVAWIESRPGDYGANGCNVCVVKHLDAGQWVLDGAPFSAVTTGGSKITDLAIVGVGGLPHVAWAEFARTSTSAGEVDSPGTVQVVRLTGGSWTPVGGALNVSVDGYANYLAMTSLGTTPLVAWQERASDGPNRLHAAHWSGTSWTADGGVLNVDTANGEAGRPTIASDGVTAWLAWTEGAPGQRSQLYVRSLASGTWSSPTVSLNAAPADGASDKPGLTVSSGIPNVVWAEHDAASFTKQIYVAGRDAAGVAVATTLAPFGSDGPAVTIADNTWVAMHPGGIAKVAWNVGDEGYDSFSYDPGTGRALVYGLYHSFAISYGENQNALLGYHFRRNRWDLMEAGELAWSENLPGAGHDEGNAVVDPVHDLYITHGNLSVGSETRYTFYVYDLKAQRGKRMTPPVDLPGPRNDQMASAFDPDHDLALFVGPGSWLYDRRANTWTSIPNPPAPRGSPCLVYDSRNKVFVLFGGGLSYAAPTAIETWICDPVARTWTQKFPARSPDGYSYPAYPFMAYDSLNGVSLLMGGGSPAMWVYDAGANVWSRLADAPTAAPLDGTDGAYLTYDSDDHVFLLRHAADIANLWAFRYVPSSTVDTTAPVISSITVTAMTADSATVTWTTNEAADGFVAFGATASHGASSALSNALTTAHSVRLSGLTAASTYHFSVTSRDAAMNAATSADGVFTTASSSATTTAGASSTGGGTAGGSDQGGDRRCGIGIGLGALLACWFAAWRGRSARRDRCAQR